MWSTLRQTHAKLKTRSNDLQKISQEMKELKKKQDAIKREVENLEREMDATSVHIVFKEAPALMEPFLTRLPREIRDLVYEYVCVHPDTIQIALPGQPGSRTDPSVVGSGGQLMDVSYLSNLEVVPTELSETYWSKNRFVIRVVPSDKPFWRVFVRPWEQIRHLKIYLACEHWESDTRYGQDKMSDYYKPAYGLGDDSTFAQAAVSKQEAQVYPLTRLKGRQELHIEIEIHTMFAKDGADVQQSERHFVNIMESIRQTVCDLIDSGVHVTVISSNVDYNEVSRGPKTWDITSRFVLDTNEWRSKEKDQIEARDRETGYFGHPQAAMYQCVPEAALADMDGFRELLLRRWKVRYALPWMEEEPEVQ
ncbi:hypothetical protein J4E83_002494 [Alternaria metachromatica]|uniref:uncharacterized protein n=1 Tax=Alternaria metachromatica TaxID=283354 RepID=UPI0020C4CFE1|nr:uncharacterized protein J4E83_002494 [Alternaria metachromatica]KAI4630968.1 hypothetical protein J4E83_002494 [Alternaria metachromatica]